MFDINIFSVFWITIILAIIDYYYFIFLIINWIGLLKIIWLFQKWTFVLFLWDILISYSINGIRVIMFAKNGNMFKLKFIFIFIYVYVFVFVFVFV